VTPLRRPSGGVWTRRQFIGRATAGSAVIALAPILTGQALQQVEARQVNAAAGVMTRPPVVTILLDQPYLDPTGLSIPYRPPSGLRSGQALAELDDQSIRTTLYWR
jgi:hypothetical protein